ncbi:hypothetical protein JBKA6_1317 [Ichthyobacterium seriolicida]|uniref:Uncharacterized protein n=2 Tax=Ichthyobacterium seriolicida TaxID=242600 RepID=A0A1J1DZI6_9FLAO|nr:hypothetical protein JBKA6_1317 [Ichthyobacterium seriolicida]
MFTFSCDKHHGEIPESKNPKEIISFKLEASKNEGKIGNKDIEAKFLEFKGQKIYFLILPSGVDSSTKEFTPTITISDNTTIEPNTDVIANLGDISITEQTIDPLNSGVEYSVTSKEDNSVSKYRVVAIRAPQGIESITFKDTNIKLDEDNSTENSRNKRSTDQKTGIDNLNEKISLSVSGLSVATDATRTTLGMEIKLGLVDENLPPPSFISIDGQKKSISISASVEETSFIKKDTEDIYEAEIPVLIKIGDLEFIKSYTIVIRPKTTTAVTSTPTGQTGTDQSGQTGTSTPTEQTGTDQSGQSGQTTQGQTQQTDNTSTTEVTTQSGQSGQTGTSTPTVQTDNTQTASTSTSTQGTDQSGQSGQTGTSTPTEQTGTDQSGQSGQTGTSQATQEQTQQTDNTSTTEASASTNTQVTDQSGQSGQTGTSTPTVQTGTTSNTQVQTDNTQTASTSTSTQGTDQSGQSG